MKTKQPSPAILVGKEETAMKHRVEKTEAAIDYIEGHLSEKLNLELVAEAVHYSKYYLHRTFYADNRPDSARLCEAQTADRGRQAAGLF